MLVYLIVHPTPSNLKQLIKKPAYVIAVDQGLFDAYKAGVDVDMAIGDFDSLQDLSLLNNVTHKKLSPNKDLTDTESAIVYAKSLNPKHIYILGGLGGLRFEHSYANLLLVKTNENLSIITNESKIVKLGEGLHTTDFKGYINIFAVKEALISLKGFKYNLDNYLLNPLDLLGISNEIEGQLGEIAVHEGSVIVIYTQKEQ
jgi:thiamine pyrophosphokinase